jgi:hypothetical protein
MYNSSVRLALLLLWPLASQASDVDAPQLGVRLTGLPSAAAAAQLTAQPGGHELTTRVGVAVLSVYREDQPAPAGSDVASPGYRATLDAKFDTFSVSIDSAAQGAPTSLAGRSAWTVVDARGARQSAGTVYVCVTYVIVDQHLYRLTVSATGSDGRPAEFDALVKALSGISFAPVRAANEQVPPPASVLQ